jgi:hypothetical protein
MASVDILISRTDSKLRSIQQELSLAGQTGKTAIAENPLLSEYLKLTSTEGIIPAIQYIALDGLARYFNLYEDDRERSQILTAMADELNRSTDGEILASIQILQYTYPEIYGVSQEQINLTQQRAIRKITGITIPESITQKIAPTSLTQLNPPQSPPIANEFQTKLMMATGMIVGAVLFGAVLAISFNKPPTSSPIVNNSPTINPPAIPTAVQNNNPVNSPPVPSSIPTATQNNNPIVPSPQQSSIPIANSSSISRDAAVKVVNQWIQYKRVLFTPPYDTSQGSNLLTDKAYINNIDRSSEPCNSSDGEGCLSSVDWLKTYNGQYSFGVQRLDSIDRFEASGDNASIFVTVTEYRTLYQNGKSKSSGGTKQSRYDLKYENGRVKISDYKVF